MTLKKTIVFSTLMLVMLPAFLMADGVAYDPHAKRDPFVPLIGQERPTSLAPLAEVASPDDIRLEGIALDATGNRMAFINGDLVKEKFKIGEVEVKKIMKSSVLLMISGQEYTIKLPDEGGKKGE
jgi:hypothetical protein